MGRPLRVVVFCGGRGSSSILRDLVRRHDVELTLIINAYDDGLSTGALRRLIPGMLGPSDFRKNLAYLLALHSRQQFDLVRIIEHRLPAGFSSADLDMLVAFLRGGGRRAPPAGVAALFAGLDPALLAALGERLDRFRAHRAAHDPGFVLDDVALGNLLFAGAYLASGRRFNAAVADLTATMGCEARLVNVSGGENRVLVALKEDGEILASEAAVVGPQSAARIADFFLLAEPLGAGELDAMVALPFEEKRARLAARSAPALISPEAREAIEAADLVVYGPGTQFSSLLPSYRTEGVREAIARSRARVKALVVNLRPDHESASLGAADIVDEALRALGDRDNARGSITHVLAGVRADGSTCLGGARPEGSFRGAAWIEDRFENAASPGIHNGHRTVAVLLSLLRPAGSEGRETIDLFVDLRERAPAASLVVQEATELDWAKRFSAVRLTLNGATVPAMALPPPLSVAAVDRGADFAEVEVLREWLAAGRTEYLATLAGDGEYRLSDVLVAVEVLRSGPFGAVFGSRNQSRRQMRGSLAYAYGEARTLYWGSWIGAYVFSGLFALRYRHLSSDPFTAFRVYRRGAIEGLAPARLAAASSGADVSKLLLGAGVEIAEIPIYYRTFQGFTNVRTRLSRGLRNALDSLR